MKTEIIFLYGPPGVGKSAAGCALAKALDLPFIDLDEHIAAQAGQSIAEIFASHGETHFRTREHDTLAELASQNSPGGVIALGGGALLDAANRTLAEGRGPIVVLQAGLETLAARLRRGGPLRPLLSSGTQQLADLLERRAGHYASFPIQLNTETLSAEETAWQIQVRLGLFHVRGGTSAGRGYDVRILPGGVECVGSLLAERGLKGPVALVCDTNTGPFYSAPVLASLEKNGYTTRLVQIPAGEEHKTLATLALLWEEYIAAGLERSSTVVTLGGGVVSDLAGFAASAYMRGVKWVGLPTTLLSMADASLGGKTGADLPQGKNLIGAFYPPELVLADPRTLTTLPAAELRSGLAEVVKHGVIGDPELFAACADLPDPASPQIMPALESIVRRAMAAKIKVIEEDPFEQGRRAVLNLGHTIGHAVETASGYKLRHGEAVAIGMVVETRLAERIGLAEAGLTETISAVLRKLGLPVEIPDYLDPETIIKTMSLDKKRAAGKHRFALPVRIGEVKIGIEIDHLRSYDVFHSRTARTQS